MLWAGAGGPLLGTPALPHPLTGVLCRLWAAVPAGLRGTCPVWLLRGRHGDHFLREQEEPGQVVWECLFLFASDVWKGNSADGTPVSSADPNFLYLDSGEVPGSGRWGRDGTVAGGWLEWQGVLET